MIVWFFWMFVEWNLCRYMIWRLVIYRIPANVAMYWKVLKGFCLLPRTLHCNGIFHLWLFSVSFVENLVMFGCSFFFHVELMCVCIIHEAADFGFGEWCVALSIAAWSDHASFSLKIGCFRYPPSLHLLYEFVFIVSSCILLLMVDASNLAISVFVLCMY